MGKYDYTKVEQSFFIFLYKLTKKISPVAVILLLSG